MTKDVPCPDASLLAQPQATAPEAAAAALWDLAGLADAAGADTLEVVLDARQHPTQSLLQPGLAVFQGPALCVNIPGT
jgi:sacsin